MFMAGMEGDFRRLGDILSVGNGSGSAEKWTSVSLCRQIVAQQRAAHGGAAVQRLTLVHFSTQPEPFLTPNTP